MNKWTAYENDEGMYDIFDCEDNYIQLGLCEEYALRMVKEHNMFLEENRREKNVRPIRQEKSSSGIN